MKRRRKLAWPLFLGASATGFLALILLTLGAKTSAQRHNQALVEAQHQEDLRTSLYRMEQRVSPLLARVLGRLEVPQVANAPISLRLDLAGERAVPLELPRATPPELVSQARAALNAENFVRLPDEQEAWLTSKGSLGSNYVQVDGRGAPRSNYEYQQRLNIQMLQNSNRGWVDPDNTDFGQRETRVEVGPVFAKWQGDPIDELVLVRDLSLNGEEVTQSLWIEWNELRTLLLGEVDDLLQGADLVPVELDASDDSQPIPEEALEGNRLVTIPARLVAPPPAAIDSSNRALWATIAATWSLALLAFATAFAAFRASQRDAARQRRFTSAVTHELRTPLTTFQMYSEMLARGMVPEERKTEYLNTLEEESRRLGGLVENVLAHARLEDGGAERRREKLSIRDILQRMEAPLRRRCLEAGTDLQLEFGDQPETQVSTDPEAISLILFNLVDNACKYGVPKDGHSAESPILLRASVAASAISLTVTDEGPGIAVGTEALIFKSFERGGRDESDNSPGVGLGLALARDLAQALRGELRLDSTGQAGATFSLQVPRET